MPSRKAEAEWNGTLREGNGQFKVGSGKVSGAYSFPTRFEEAPGTNPEELIGAAHASCFSMALAAGLTKAGHKPTKINTTATVHVYIGGVEMPGSPFALVPGESTRKSFPNVNSGPVKIVSDVPIVAAERLIYKVKGVATSFSEMMALPQQLLSGTYWLPWYNNADLDTQLRFGVP